VGVAGTACAGRSVRHTPNILGLMTTSGLGADDPAPHRRSDKFYTARE
jgi:hypothetical protein